MIFNKHYEVEGQHAEIMSPSNPSWLNYDLEKLETVWRNKQAVKMGTRLHALAAEHIDLGLKMPKSRTTLNMYINDSIGYRNTPEQKLLYSTNCFGTADSISFNKNVLRIFDLKTGSTPAHIEQLEIYAALFCLEYGIKPSRTEFDLRIYQTDDIIEGHTQYDDIEEIMGIIKKFDAKLNTLNARKM